MMLILYGTVAALTIGLVFGGIRWWKELQRWKGLEEQVSVIQDIADEASTEAERLDKLRETQDSTFADSVTKLHTKIAGLERADVVSAEREDSLTQALADLIDDPAALSTLAKLQEQHQQRIRSLRLIIFSKDEEISMFKARVATRDSIMANLWTALEAQEELTEFWKDEAKPKFWRDTGRAIPQVLGGIAVGILFTTIVIN